MRLHDVERLSRYGHVVLSAHLDDAVLSFGGSIARLAQGSRVLVATMTAGLPRPDGARSKLARELTQGSSAADYVLMRRDEDLSAATVLGADVFWESSLDAIYRDARYGRSFTALFGSPVAEDPLGPRTRALIELVLRRAPRAVVWAPLGIGGHVDHRLVSDAAIRAAQISPDRVRFYEDFPYAARPHELDRRLAELDAPRRLPRARRRRDLLEFDVAVKVRAIARYRSQVVPLFGEEAPMARAVRRFASGARSEAEPSGDRRPDSLRPVPGEFAGSPPAEGHWRLVEDEGSSRRRRGPRSAVAR